jgi:hypothetical protein
MIPDALCCCSADSISRANQILASIPGKATGAYSHSQVTVYNCTFCYLPLGQKRGMLTQFVFSYFPRVSKDFVMQLLLGSPHEMDSLLMQMTSFLQMEQVQGYVFQLLDNL